MVERVFWFSFWKRIILSLNQDNYQVRCGILIKKKKKKTIELDVA